MVASAQQWPASSRATATATIVRRLPRRSSACQRAWRRRALWSACDRTAAGWPCRRRSSAVLARSGRRWCQAASTSSRRAWVLPVFVVAPWRRRSPEESSLGTRPTEAPPVAELDGERERGQGGDPA